MPALSPEQRKRQRQLQIQREEENARALAPRRGSKVARSSMKGATTKGETVGGAKPQAKPTKPAAESTKTREYYGPGGKAQPAADKKPATPPVKATAQRTTVMPRNPSPAPKAAPKQETKAAAQSYRDKEDTKGLSVGRYRTLAEHRAAVAKQKGAVEPSTKADSQAMQISGTLKAMGISPKTGVPDLNAKDAVTPETKKKKKK
jgi:hypothetical protein